MKRPLALGCASFLAGLFLSLSIGLIPLFCSLIGLTVLLAVLLLCTAGKGKAAYPAVSILPMLCAILFCAVFFLLPTEKAAEKDGETVTVTFKCTEVYYSADWGGSLAGVMTGCAGEKCRLPVYVTEEGGCGISRGDTVTAEASVAFDRTAKPDERIRLTLTPEGITARKSASSVFLFLNETASDRLHALLPDSSAGLLSALLLGNREQVPFGASAVFSNLGISHLLAVSGLHLTILLAALDLLLLRLPLPKKTRSLTSCLAVVFYILLTGAHLSVLRAGIMQLVLRLSDVTDREYDPPTSLAFAAALICLADPYSILDAGLQMSVCATLGILLCASLPEKAKDLPALLRVPLSALLVSTAASVFVYPVTALTVGRISLVSIPATVLTSIPVELSMLLGLALLVLSRIPLLGEALASLCAISAGQTLALTDRLSSLGRFEVVIRGLSLLPLLLLPLFLFLALRKTKKKKRTPALLFSLCFLLCAAMTPILSLPAKNAAHIAARSDGKNDSLLFRENGRVLLADFSDGTSGALNRSVKALREDEGIVSPDALLLTHYHAKYAQSVYRLLDRELLSVLFLPTPASESETQIASVLSSLAERVGCTVCFFDGKIEWNGYSLSPKREYLTRSTHPVQTMTAERNGRTLLYLGASFADLPEPAQTDADILFLGAHGPVVHTQISPPAMDFFLSSAETGEKYGLTGGVLLPEDGKWLVLAE